CIFRTPVREGCVMQPAEVKVVLSRGAETGCTEALFTFGERPEEEPGFPRYLEKIGYSSIIEYCVASCNEAIGWGLLPHTNAGILSFGELEELRSVNASMGLMLETTAEIPAHRNSPGKDPQVRIEMIENAGKLKIPFTTGILIGIGETPEDRLTSLEVIREIHRRYGHIQEVIIQNFTPKEGTRMASAPVPRSEEICETIMAAREILPRGVAVQIPPNLADASSLIECGVDDLGGVSPLTIDYVNPEHPWPQIEQLKNLIGDNILRERLCIYPRFIEKGWYPPILGGLIGRLSREIGERGP
ncbi:MAG: 7,8-didemethyl-8-hydroxy-5-deazariboflavin synthase CofG, partial [Methanomicrobiaceae archaeon]|nr:7,8-didemethyl-8-hydroxy-5-deazariboflavin synthase CofG [Methanomicrobiaceae archaeon]